MNDINIEDYYILHDKIERRNRNMKLGSKDSREIRVGILGNFTLSGIKEVLSVKCDENGLILKSYEAPYGQYNQEILDPSSRLYKLKPHLSVLFLDITAFLGENYYFPYRLTEKQRRSLINYKTEEVCALIKAFCRNSTAKLLVHNFAVPVYSPLGILESREKFGFFDMVRALNLSVKERFRGDSQVFIFDYDSFLSNAGKKQSVDERMRILADMRIGRHMIAKLCDEYMRYINAMKGKAKKCLVLDLDNTLWGGIVGEDGFSGILLSQSYPGNCYSEFQKCILSLFDRGILLAINSSNNYDDAMKVIREHPGMVLKERNFASIRINWKNKLDNLVGIARELNIGLDSLVFADDDKRTCQLVRESLPQVTVLDLPEDPALYADALKSYKGFDALHVTHEDRRRGHMYAEERARKESKSRFSDINGFLKHLKTVVTIEKVHRLSESRISQLTQRTNQFNFTTKRYSEEEIRLMAEDRSYLMYSVAVKDRFGDSGISGLVIIKKENDNMAVDTFLLSCRVLGKGIEKALMAFCCRAAKKHGARYLVCEYRKTGKNAPALNFLKESGLLQFKTIKGGSLWRCDVNRCSVTPEYIKVTEK